MLQPKPRPFAPGLATPLSLATANRAAASRAGNDSYLRSYLAGLRG